MTLYFHSAPVAQNMTEAVQQWNGQEVKFVVLPRRDLFARGQRYDHTVDARRFFSYDDHLLRRIGRDTGHFLCRLQGHRPSWWETCDGRNALLQDSIFRKAQPAYWDELANVVVQLLISSRPGVIAIYCSQGRHRSLGTAIVWAAMLMWMHFMPYICAWDRYEWGTWRYCPCKECKAICA